MARQLQQSPTFLLISQSMECSPLFMRDGAIEITYYNGSAQFCYSTSPESSMHPAIVLYTPPAKIALVSHYRMHQVQSCMHVLPCNNFINGSGPSYIAALLHVYTLSFMFHFSSDSCILNIQQCKCIWLSLLFFLLRTLRLELTGKQTQVQICSDPLLFGKIMLYIG